MMCHFWRTVSFYRMRYEPPVVDPGDTKQTRDSSKNKKGDWAGECKCRGGLS